MSTSTQPDVGFFSVFLELWKLMWHVQFILTLSPESPGPPGGPEAPGGPGRPYFEANKSHFTHIIHAQCKHKETSHICSSKVLAFILQSGHTWEKGMHEAIWDSLLSCKSFVRRSLFVYSSTLEWLYSVGLHLQGVKSNCVWKIFLDK